jgi:dihydrofolate synthase / folylpolyglutamate synthase
MKYERAIQTLYALSPRGIELGLGRMERALALRGHPERACPSVLVAGTNGKGSVATLIASVLASAGLRVGLFTSPHLHRLVERFRISGRPVAERTLARHVSALTSFLAHEDTPKLTFFEVCTLLAFELFREARCDVMVLEVGLGGRLDSTNVVTPLVSVISSIALDHTDRLGSTITAIAREKAGIIKPGVPVIVGSREPAALAVIRKRARQLGAPLLAIDREFKVEPSERGLAYVRDGRRIEALRLSLPGAYQADNLGCALAALTSLAPDFTPDERAIRRGVSRARWPGRLELLAGAPDVLCDAAHNPHACRALAQHLASACAHYPRRVLVFGAMRDKDCDQMIALLRPHVDAIVFTSAGTSRSHTAAELVARHGGEAREQPARALARAQKLATKRGLVIACGSIFVMAELRARVLGIRADPPIAM